MNCDLCQHEREENNISRVLCIPCAEMIIRLLNCDSVSARNELFRGDDERYLLNHRSDVVKLLRSNRCYVLFRAEYEYRQYYAICRVRRNIEDKIVDVEFLQKRQKLTDIMHNFEVLNEEAANA